MLLAIIQNSLKPCHASTVIQWGNHWINGHRHQRFIPDVALAKSYLFICKAMINQACPGEVSHILVVRLQPEAGKRQLSLQVIAEILGAA